MQFLNMRLRQPLKFPDPLLPDHVIDMKFELRSRLLAEAITSYPEIMETNSSPDDLLGYHDYRLRYHYQRYDMDVIGPPVYPGLFADTGPDRVSLFQYYASSGMSAIAGALLALNRAVGTGWNIVAYGDTYFETQHIIREMAHKLSLQTPEGGNELISAVRRLGRTTTGGIVLLLDSIVSEAKLDVIRRLPAHSADLILFDTTCYEICAPEIGRIAECAIALQAPLVLLRSHVKLDFLGTEYGRLGSAVFASRGDIPPARMNVFRRLVTLYRDVACVLGLAALPGNLIPEANDAELLELNAARLSVIRENTGYAVSRIQREVSGLSCNVVAYHHQLFFSIELERDASHELILAKIMEFQQLAVAQGLPVRRATSFGFDFIAVADFVDLNRGSQVMRFSISDHPKPVIDSFCDLLAGWCRAQTKETIMQGRLALVQANNRRGARHLGTTLAGTGCRIITYDHDRFFAIGIGAADAETDLADKIGELTAHARAAGIPASNERQFSFEVITISPYDDPGSGLPMIRIALSDHPHQINTAFCDLLGDWCRNEIESIGV